MEPIRLHSQPSTSLLLMREDPGNALERKAQSANFNIFIPVDRCFRSHLGNFFQTTGYRVYKWLMRTVADDFKQWISKMWLGGNKNKWNG